MISVENTQMTGLKQWISFEGFKKMMQEGENANDEFLNFFDEFESVSFMGGYDHMKFEVIMKDKETNALEVITAKMMNQVVENAEMMF